MFPKSSLKLGLLAAGLPLTAWLAAAAALYFRQEKLIFQGEPRAPDHKLSTEWPAEDVLIEVPGARLHGLHFRHETPRGLVFFLHGNCGDVATWAPGSELVRRAGFDLFMLDYRGFGWSSGRIESEAQLNADVRTAWDQVAPYYKERKLPIVIYGRSLGSGLAVPLARQVDPTMLILATPFTSLAKTACRRYPFVPERLVKYPLRSDQHISEVKCPILLVHGTHDELIPIQDSEALLTLAKSPAELMRIDGAAHGNIHEFPAYLDGLEMKLKQVGAAM
jgi:alpha-beta hydrolase superfamily lysophospholipase